MNTIDDCRVIELKKISDPRGNLSVVQQYADIPCEIKRVYFLYDVPGGESRADHAHKSMQQLLIAMSGSFDVTVDDGKKSKKYHLNRAYYGLYIPPMIWRGIDNFSSGAVCLAIVNTEYNAEDYIRDYSEFKNLRN